MLAGHWPIQVFMYRISVELQDVQFETVPLHVKQLVLHSHNPVIKFLTRPLGQVFTH